MQSSNPALNDKVFQRGIANSRSGGGFRGAGSPADEVPPNLFGGRRGSAPPAERGPTGDQQTTPQGTTPSDTSWSPPDAGPVQGDTMRLGGTLSASAILLGFLLVAAYFGYQAVTTTTVSTPQGPETSVDMPPWLIGSFIVALVLAIVTIVKPKFARVTAPLFAVAEGLVVGAISHAYEAQFDGIVLQAVGLTIGVFVMMLVLYGTGTIKVTDKLRKGIFAATGAVALVYLATIGARMFGAEIPMIHDSGPVGILFSLVVVGIASANLLLDFDFIERGVKMGAPRYMEWFGAFGLMVTLVWLYLELLRLLSKLRSS